MTTEALEAVDAKKAHAAELETTIEGLRKEEADLSRQLAEAIAAGKEHTSELKARRRQVRDELEDSEAALPLVREKIQREQETAALEAIEKRQLGLKRSHGSLRSEYEGDDVARIEAAARKFVEAVRRFNERYDGDGGLAKKELEDEALAARWGRERVITDTVLPPVMNERARAGIRLVRSASLADWFRPSTDRARRQAIAGTPGAKLLELPGPTKAEKRKQAEAETRDQAKQAKEAEAASEVGKRVKEIKELPDNVPLVGGWSGY